MMIDRGSRIRLPCQRRKRSVAAVGCPLRHETLAEYVARVGRSCKSDATLPLGAARRLEVA